MTNHQIAHRGMISDKIWPDALVPEPPSCRETAYKSEWRSTLISAALEADGMSRHARTSLTKGKRPKAKLGLPDLDHSKSAVLDSSVRRFLNSDLPAHRFREAPRAYRLTGQAADWHGKPLLVSPARNAISGLPRLRSEFESQTHLWRVDCHRSRQRSRSNHPPHRRPD